MTSENSCSVCGGDVDTEDLKVATTAKAPWHFWVMVIALAMYLGWRAVAGVLWLVERV